jgi:nicotinamide N-methyltransferase
VADYLEEHASKYITGRNVLELGAGAGLPSLVSAINGARKVIVTDYPDPDLIENLKHNIRHCSLLPDKGVIEAAVRISILPRSDKF